MVVIYRGLCKCGYESPSFQTGRGISPIWDMTGWREEEPALCRRCKVVYVRDRLRDTYSITCHSCGNRYSMHLQFKRSWFDEDIHPPVKEVICPSCSAVTVVKGVWKKRLSCPKCRGTLSLYAHDPSLSSRRSDSKEHSRGVKPDWNSGWQFLCPKCGEMQMMFVAVMLTD